MTPTIRSGSQSVIDFIRLHKEGAPDLSEIRSFDASVDVVITHNDDLYRCVATAEITTAKHFVEVELSGIMGCAGALPDIPKKFNSLHNNFHLNMDGKLLMLQRDVAESCYIVSIRPITSARAWAGYRALSEFSKS